MSTQEGLRYNAGKTRYDLVPAFAQEQYAQVLTKGAIKYASRNWENGMAWSKITQSLKRHTAAIEAGEDYDKETGLLHAAHVMCNAAFLTEYYKIYPQGDDRPHKYLRPKKIGLDIDGVLADFMGGLMERFPEIPGRSVYWNDYETHERFMSVKGEKQFWLDLKPLVDPKGLPFEPHCYITARTIDTATTEEWLANHGFPRAKVYTVGHNANKIDIAKESGIDVFVDDYIKNFQELSQGGIFTYLMDAPHNQRYDVGFRRIKSLNEIV